MNSIWQCDPIRRSPIFSVAILCPLLAMLFPALLRAELQVETQRVETQTSAQSELTIFKMTVTPAAEPVPALKHRLVLREIDEKSGNAAPMYYRAIMISTGLNKVLKDRFGDEYANAWPEPDRSIQQAFELATTISGSSMMSELREAALRRDCDWGFDLQSIRGPNLYSFMLPEIQECRMLSRYVMIVARLAILEQRYDDAIDHLRVNVKLAEDTAAEPLLVSGLVGIAIASMGNRAIIDLMAAPDSPNLYWALTELPDPLIDLRPAMRFEMSSILRIFPFLRDAETQEHTPEEWARVLSAAPAELEPLLSQRMGFQNDVIARATATGLALVSYVPAKERLIAAGFDANRVEQMPVGQVIAIDAAREFRRLADECEKWMYLPYGAARDNDDDVISNELAGENLAGGFGRILAGYLLPASSSARDVQERYQWQVDGLRTVEAIRMHAAATGKLPATLEEITVVPVPVNRATGKMYDYRLDNDTAVLELPFSDGFRVAWRFEIKLAD